MASPKECLTSATLAKVENYAGSKMPGGMNPSGPASRHGVWPANAVQDDSGLLTHRVGDAAEILTVINGMSPEIRS